MPTLIVLYVVEILLDLLGENEEFSWLFRMSLIDIELIYNIDMSII
jgi:hypothetical protein